MPLKYPAAARIGRQGDSQRLPRVTGVHASRAEMKRVSGEEKGKEKRKLESVCISLRSLKLAVKFTRLEPEQKSRC